MFLGLFRLAGMDACLGVLLACIWFVDVGGVAAGLVWHEFCDLGLVCL